MNSPAQAFARARRYLTFQRGASTLAITAGVLIGAVSVGYLIVAALMLDLFVHQGRAVTGPSETPAAVLQWSARHLSPEAQQEMLAQLQRGSGIGLARLAARCDDRWYGPLITAPAAAFAFTRSSGSWLAGLIARLLTLAVVHPTLALIMAWAAAQATADASHRLRRSIYVHSLRLGRLTLRGQAGDAFSAFTRDLEAVQDGLYTFLTTTIKEPARFLMVLVFLLLVDSAEGIPWLAFTGLILVLIAWLLGGEFANYFRQRERRASALAAEHMAQLQESLQLTRLVKGYGLDAFNLARVERQLAKYGASARVRFLARALFRHMLVLLAVCGAAVLAYVVGWNLLGGEMSWARALIVLVALASLYLPLRRLLASQRVLDSARRGAQAVFKFLESQADVRQVVGAELLQPLRDKLEFQKVTLRPLASSEPLLDQVSFTIHAGEHVALVGQDEESKRALAFLLPRFVDPTEGEIRIDGHRLPYVTLESLRLNVMLVLQDDLVFTDTAANNIGGGDPSYPLPKIIEAAKLAHAHKFIQALPEGYETVIGDLGHTLTLSEKYRIALARAILRDPALVVIEEPDVPLDDDTKTYLDDTMSRFLPGRTAIFIAHRLSTIRAATRVFLLHKGRLEAEGTHRELLQRSERYLHLQYLEFNVFAADA
ncbi:MAG TPA: ABC transporter ATP-binding protein [Gemmatales bacterium]|nr:ABC transporter ATP-binding protein [Gemmatales bacterium]